MEEAFDCGDDTREAERDIRMLRQKTCAAALISDRDKRFTSNFWVALMQILWVNHKLSTAYHPQTDGQTERLNQVLEQYLRFYVDDCQDNWIQLLLVVQIAYNQSSTTCTGTSPFFVNYGFEPRDI
jgi:transposase InsO family protein